MIINLKQSEIELALRAYVVSQGISLHGKDLSISFTAGRRESGISAEISIDEVEIPGYSNEGYIPEEPQAVKAAVISLAPAATTEVPAEVEEAQPVDQEEKEAQEEVAPAGETKQTVSLFG